MIESDQKLWPLFDKPENQKMIAGKVCVRSGPISEETGIPSKTVRDSARRWRQNNREKKIEPAPFKPDKTCDMSNVYAEERKFYQKPIKFSGRPYKVAVLADMHIPHPTGRVFHPAAIAVIKWLKDNHCDEIILLGDYGNFDSICWQDEDKPLKKEGKRLKAEYAAMNYGLDTLQTCADKITWLEGNHEMRVVRRIEKSPEYSGMLEPRYMCKLSHRKIDYVDYNIPYELGAATFIHGFKRRKYEAMHMATQYGTAIYYGHTHNVQSFCTTNWKTGPIEGMSLGCLTDLIPEYWKNKPSDVHNAFGIFYFNDDGAFTRYVPIIIKGRFVGPDGRVYDGNK